MVRLLLLLLVSFGATSKELSVHYRILLSDSMGKSAIRQLMHDLGYRDDVQFVIRGMLEHESRVAEVAERVHGWVEGIEPMPNVSIDPRPFDHVQAAQAPMILAYQAEKLLAYASGIANPVWLENQLVQGKRGNLGDFSGSVAINERHFTDQVIAKIAELDLVSMIEKTKTNYWKKVPFVLLPESNVSQRIRFTPLLTVNKTIYDDQGNILIAAGTRINTLEKLSFTQNVIVFDATNPKHLEFSRKLSLRMGINGKFITTKIDRSLSWNAIKHIEQQLHRDIYLLNKDIVSAFNLTAIPAVITADNTRKEFIVEYFKL